jgi:hypothetical protein
MPTAPPPPCTTQLPAYPTCPTASPASTLEVPPSPFPLHTPLTSPPRPAPPGPRLRPILVRLRPPLGPVPRRHPNPPLPGLPQGGLRPLGWRPPAALRLRQLRNLHGTVLLGAAPSAAGPRRGIRDCARAGRGGDGAGVVRGGGQVPGQDEYVLRLCGLRKVPAGARVGRAVG